MNTKINEAIEKAGGRAAVAKHFGISRQGVEFWLKTGSVPPKKCVPLSKLTGYTISAAELNPEVFGA